MTLFVRLTSRMGPKIQRTIHRIVKLVVVSIVLPSEE